MNVVKPRVTTKMLRHLRDRVYQISRASDNQRVLENISGPLGKALKIVEQEVDPRAIYRQFPLISSNEKTVMTQAGPIDSPMFSSLVNRSQGSRNVVFILLTLGPELENSIDSRHDILSQWVYDIVGSELIEVIADEVENRLNIITQEKQFELSRRFSPGYCDWSVDGQQTIFKALDAEKIGVTLTPKNLMIPKKSISCIMVSASKVPIKSQCLLCHHKECPFRRRKDE